MRSIMYEVTIMYEVNLKERKLKRDTLDLQTHTHTHLRRGCVIIWYWTRVIRLTNTLAHSLTKAILKPFLNMPAGLLTKVTLLTKCSYLRNVPLTKCSLLTKCSYLRSVCLRKIHLQSVPTYEMFLLTKRIYLRSVPTYELYFTNCIHTLINPEISSTFDHWYGKILMN